jgi:hypothetical protein
LVKLFGKAFPTIPKSAVFIGIYWSILLVMGIVGTFVLIYL